MTENPTAAEVVCPTVHRRCLLAGGAGAAMAVLLAGCGDGSSTGDPTGAASSTGGGETGGDDPTDSGNGGASGGSELGAAADVAVGAGVIFTDQKVVVTQPTEGDFKAFDTTCTHAGCPVASVTDTINCDCHGSQFSIEDGSVVGGPAPEPLAPKNVTVEGGKIILA